MISFYNIYKKCITSLQYVAIQLSLYHYTHWLYFNCFFIIFNAFIINGIFSLISIKPSEWYIYFSLFVFNSFYFNHLFFVLIFKCHLYLIKSIACQIFCKFDTMKNFNKFRMRENTLIIQWEKLSGI